jgi:hypothetical protein
MALDWKIAAWMLLAALPLGADAQTVSVSGAPAIDAIEARQHMQRQQQIEDRRRQREFYRQTRLERMERQREMERSQHAIAEQRRQLQQLVRSSNRGDL